MEKKKKKKKPSKLPLSSRTQSKSPPFDLDNIDLSQTVALPFEEKKKLMQLHAIKYQPEGKSSKSKLIVLKATNHNYIESRVTKSKNHGKETDSSKSKSNKKTDSGSLHKDQTFRRGGGITFDEDSNTYHNNSGTEISARQRRSGGRGRGQGRQGRRGRGPRTTTTGKTISKIKSS